MFDSYRRKNVTLWVILSYKCANAFFRIKIIIIIIIIIIFYLNYYLEHSNICISTFKKTKTLTTSIIISFTE